MNPNAVIEEGAADAFNGVVDRINEMISQAALGTDITVTVAGMSITIAPLFVGTVMGLLQDHAYMLEAVKGSLPTQAA